MGSSGRPYTTAAVHLPPGMMRIPDVEESIGEGPGLLRNTSQQVSTKRSVSLVPLGFLHTTSQRVGTWRRSVSPDIGVHSDSDSEDEKAGVLLKTRKAAFTSDEADDEKSTGPETDSIQVYHGNTNSTTSTIRFG